MHIYVGNLTLKFKDAELRKIFSKFGKVDSANVYKDRCRENSEALGFVKMLNKDEALEAISKLNGKTIKGVKIEVHVSRSRNVKRTKKTERRKKSI